VTVEVQNRSAHNEVIPDIVALQQLVSLAITPTGPACNPGPTVKLHQRAGQPRLPFTLRARARMFVTFDVTFACAIDGQRGAGHGDYTVSAILNHSALGSRDGHPDNDFCPRSVTPPGAKGRGILDRGCGTLKPDRTYGDPIPIDVISRR
jgi:hypothetical protein